MYREKTIIFKVEGSNVKGMGHVFRSFFLIQNLKKNYKIIIFTEKSSESEKYFILKGLKVYSYTILNQTKIFKKIVSRYKSKIFINDYLFIRKEIQNILINNKIKSYFLDTKNVLQNDNFYSIDSFLKTKKKRRNYFYGLKYIIIDPEIKKVKYKNLKKYITIVLHFGGTDLRKLNLKVVKLLENFSKKIYLKIIIGPSVNYSLKKLTQLLKNLKFKYKIYNYPEKLNNIYNKCDLAVISGGTTLFNFCSLRKANISISTNNYEKKNCAKMEKNKLTSYLGHHNNVSNLKLHKSITKILKNKRLSSKITFDGINNISNIIKK